MHRFTGTRTALCSRSFMAGTSISSQTSNEKEAPTGHASSWGGGNKALYLSQLTVFFPFSQIIILGSKLHFLITARKIVTDVLMTRNLFVGGNNTQSSGAGKASHTLRPTSQLTDKPGMHLCLLSADTRDFGLLISTWRRSNIDFYTPV